MSELVESTNHLTFDHMGNAIARRDQDVTELVEYCKRQRIINDLNRGSMGGRDNVSVCSVPQAVVDDWISSGFDFWNATASDITAKLKAEGLDHFISHNGKF